MSAEAAPQGKLAVQWVALIFGLGFLAAGVMGFIPGFTRNFELMTAAGLDSGALLLSTFPISVAHNIVHLVFGLAGLICWLSAAGARNYLRWGGVAYLLLWVVAFAVTSPSTPDLQINTIGAWVWPVIAVAMFVLSFLRFPRPRAQGA